MLGRTLQRHFRHHEVFIADLPEVDITDGRSIGQAVAAFGRMWSSTARQ